MKILITGGNGYIANACINSLKNRSNVQVDIITRNNLNLLNTKNVKSFFINKYYDVVIHTAIVGGSRLHPDVKENAFENLLMFENIVECSYAFNKLISFGSGAEIYAPNTPYGLSKKVINKLINNFDNAYNIRLYGVFNENELTTRFIKSCILACQNDSPINIHQDRLFDFFYMVDLLSLVDHYVFSNNNLPKTVNCCYSTKIYLKEIASFICSCFNKQPNSIINIVNSQIGEPYIGINDLPGHIKYIGLKEGIVRTINQLNLSC